MNEKMFQTYNRDTYYRRENGTWFVEKNNKKSLVGWKCIGSINLSCTPQEYVEKLQLLIDEEEEELQNRLPSDFIPYFKMGNHPLTVKKGRNGSIMEVGASIIEVYRWI